MVFDLLIYDPQGLRVLGGNDNAAGVPVDPVAQGGRKGVLPFGIPLFFLVQVGLNVVDEGVDLLRLIGVDHQTRPLVHQQQILVFVHDVQLGTEHGEKDVFLRGLVKELVVDI